MRSNNTEKYQKIVNLISEILPYDENGNKRIYVPQVVFVKNGKIIGGDNETSYNVEGTPSEYWTSETIANLKQKLTNLIKVSELNYCSTCN